jgi:rhodanese-related sulfurtransferase
MWKNARMIRKGIKELIAEAERRTQGISVDEAKKRLGEKDTVFVDLRDVRELERDGMIPGAFHAPRGMLEFWVDPQSPYYKSVFAEGKTFILYCQADWRGVLAAATLADMGMPGVLHLEGGFGEWRKAGGPAVARPHKPPEKKKP